ncbi:hypothetical protein J4423_03340 [Candidatus Pacearchaeota archaeon]|nr:hypothetical protein [Candidatus Pacearchaeota archaeon]
MVLELVVLLLSIPTGLLIAWLAKDELIDGFVYIKILFVLSLIGIIFFENEVTILSLGFICIVSYISVLKRFDKKWAVERKR